jgi:hypothetical protein
MKKVMLEHQCGHQEEHNIDYNYINRIRDSFKNKLCSNCIEARKQEILSKGE